MSVAPIRYLVTLCIKRDNAASSPVTRSHDLSLWESFDTANAHAYNRLVFMKNSTDGVEIRVSALGAVLVSYYWGFELGKPIIMCRPGAP